MAIIKSAPRCECTHSYLKDWEDTHISYEDNHDIPDTRGYYYSGRYNKQCPKCSFSFWWIKYEI